MGAHGVVMKALKGFLQDEGFTNVVFGRVDSEPMD